jgi:hypothetical protein
MSEIMHVEETGKNLPGRNKYSIEDFKAFSYVFNGKRDTDIQVFNENKQFKKEDIVSLFNKINGKLQTHHIVINQFAINVTLSDGLLKEYSNWEVFIKEDWNIPERTFTILVEWDFFLNHENFKFPQKHSLKIRIGSGVRPDELFKLVMTGNEDHDLIEASAELVCKIDFINPFISNDLKNVVSKWYNALSNNKEPNRAVTVIKNNRGKIVVLNKLLFMSAGLILLNSIVRKYYELNDIKFDSGSLLASFFSLISVTIIVVYCFYAMGKFYGDRIESRTIRNFRSNPMFAFTQGDINRNQQNRDKNNKLIKKLGKEISIAIVINVLMVFLGKLVKEMLILFFG